MLMRVIPLLAFIAIFVAASSMADPVATVQSLREGGCGGTLPYRAPLRRSALLDQAATRWSRGAELRGALESSGYRASTSSGLHIRAAGVQLLDQMRKSCRSVTDPQLREVGVYLNGQDTWLVFAAPEAIIAHGAAPLQASRILELINSVRARGATCGSRSFGPAPPVSSSALLAGVALGHATDMALHDYFEHEDLSGHTPADRVRATGYKEKLVGENIAYGPQSADEVVQGWLESPGHCENIMDPRFAEMGVAFAPGKSTRRGLYWVQLFAEPKA
jgi:uncharacterized protein YkwD